MIGLLVRHRKKIILLTVALIHVAALAFVRFASPQAAEFDESSYEILKLVDVEEYVPPPETAATVVYNQPQAAERVVETEDTVVEVTSSAEIEYVPQHKISIVPEIPTKEVLGRIRYPSLALRQEIEGVVYLELFIDTAGVIRKIQVLKDPGYGFADAAIEALTGIRCKPAISNGSPVAVRYRYPVRFTLQR